MKLIYDGTSVEVKVGDRAKTFRGEMVEVLSFDKPHKPSASGRVMLKSIDSVDKDSFRSYVTVIGATWIDREDRMAY